jgi:hypothetical protein
LTSKFSRAALIASLTIGAGGLVAVPAEAANGISTANYYVNNPAIGGASNITPESALVSASIDTGGSPESLLPVPSTGLTWSPIAEIAISPEKWNDGTSPSQTVTNDYAPIDGIPISGANSDLSVTVTDTKIVNGGVDDPGIKNSGTPEPTSNAGADNYSDVTFEYDPVSDFVANGNLPGPQIGQASDIQVPTTSGLANVQTAIGAFGQAAQNNTGNTPLKPGTKYYYWVIQQAGATTAASNVDVAAWTGNVSGTPAEPANNSYKCYPNVAIEDDPTLAGYLAPGATVTYGGQALPADQGPCIYYYGDTGGATYYQSPNGEFATRALGKVKIGAKALVKMVKGKETPWLTVTSASAYRAAGTLYLTVGGKLAGTAKFNVQPKAKATAKITLTSKGRKALAKNQTVKVAPVSQTANIASVSNWDQPLVGKSVKL